MTHRHSNRRESDAPSAPSASWACWTRGPTFSDPTSDVPCPAVRSERQTLEPGMGYNSKPICLHNPFVRPLVTTASGVSLPY